MAAIATIRGTAIAPGVSRNGRLYTADLLGRAVERARERIASGEPLTMLTHHGAEDDSTRIVGRVTALEQRPDGSVAFEAEIADTAHGRDIAALVTGDKPFLDGVSIRGAWRGRPRREDHDGQSVETGDDLDLHGLDFTKTPGVLAARIDRHAAQAPAETSGPAHLVYESVTEASVAKAPPVAPVARYADLGFRDGVKRLPIDTRAAARQSWRAISETAGASAYTPQQLKRIRHRVRAALTRFGVPVESTKYGPVTEFYGDEPSGGGGFCIDAHNGPISVSVRCCGIDPAELRVIAAAAMNAAVDALQCLDPDMDADIDVSGAPLADTDGSEARRPDDNQMESAPRYVAAGDHATAEHWDLVRRAGIATPPGTVLTAAVVNEAIDILAETAPAAPAEASVTTPQEVPAVSEPTPAVETATPAPVIQLTQEQFAQLLGRTAPAPAQEAAPAVAPVVETEDERIARIVAERLAVERTALEETLRAEVRQSGPARKGLRTEQPGGPAVGESEEDIRRNTNEALLHWVSNGRYSMDN